MKMDKTFLIGLLVLVILYVLFVIWEGCMERYSNNIYRTGSDNNKDTAKTYLNRVKLKYYKNPIDFYRIGSIQDFVFKNSELAHYYYTKSLQTIDQNGDQEETFFIRDRIRDRIDINNNVEEDNLQFNLHEIEDLDREINVLERLLEHGDRRNDVRRNAMGGFNRNYNMDPIVITIGNNTDIIKPKPKPTILDKSNKRRKWSKLISSDKEKFDDANNTSQKLKWITDTQNVHDSNINNEVRTQFNFIKNSVESSGGSYIWEINEIIGYIKNIYSENVKNSEKHNIEPAIKMLEFIDFHSNTNIVKINTSERKFIGYVFAFIQLESDVNKRQLLMENFLLNLKDCYQKGHPVCITGRLTRIMATFIALNDDGSTNDDAPNLGVFKSKQVVKNEIIMKAGNIRNKFLEELSDNDKKIYIEDDGMDKSKSEKIDEWIDIMYKRLITVIERDYPELKDTPNGQKFINEIIDECVASF